MAFGNFILILGLLYSIIPSTDCQQLSVSPHGSQVKSLHSRVIFSCIFSDDGSDEGDGDSLDFKWIGPQMLLISETRGRIHVEQVERNVVKLYIHDVQETDAGVYSCQLTRNGRLFTEAVQLSIFEDIHFGNKSASYLVRVGEKSVLLECSAFGLPLPKISWRFNKTKLPEVSEKYVYEEEGLRVYDVTRDDGGMYECRAQVETQGSLKIRYISLSVMYPPVITQPPIVSEPVIRGHDVVLRCAADGNPPPKYEWLLEKRISSIAKAKVPLHRGNETLTIEAIDSQKEGSYFCRVSNSVGTKEASVDIVMLVPPGVKDLENQSTVEGRTLILPCELAMGRPPPSLFWSRQDTGQVFDRLTIEGNALEDESISIDNTHHGVSKLIIRNVQRGHAGDYVCWAVNDVGNSSKTATIKVDYVPRITSTFTEVYGWTGQVRNLTCMADGQPLPVVSWISRGQHIFDTVSYKIESAKTNISTSTLQITIGNKQPWVFGNYTCVAKNLHGSASSTFQLREAEVPSMPHNVSVMEVSDTKVVFMVEPPRKTGGIPLTSWMIKYEKVEREASEKTTFFDPHLDDNPTTMTVAQLEPNSEYTFYLAAGNDVDFGDPIKILIKTRPKAVSNELSDVPYQSGHMENIWKDPAALGKSQSEEATQANGKSVGVALGVVSAIAALILTLAGAALWYRRRKDEPRGILCRFDGLKSSKKKEEERLKEANAAENIIQMVEVGHPSDVRLLSKDTERRSNDGGFAMKDSESHEGGFGLSPRPCRVLSPARSLTVTPNSVRKFTGDHWYLTHESNDDVSSGFGTAEPDSIQSDIPVGLDDESGARGAGLAHRDPDLDSIPDIDDEELDQS